MHRWIWLQILQDRTLSLRKNMNKKKWCMLSYDTTEPVDAFVQEEDEIRRLFLKFNKDHIKVSNYYTPLVVPNTDIIVEVFINSEGVFGFKESKNNVQTKR